MALEKHRAVVLRTMKYGETSKIVTLYSLRAGLIKLVAKGVRKSKSRLGGILEPLNIVEVIFYHKSQRELHTLNQTSIIFSPIQLRRDAEDTLLAYACCEMITRVQMLHDENSEVYHLLEETIKIFNSSIPETRRIYFLTYQLQLLRSIGLDPGFEACVRCATTKSDQWNYDFQNAHLYCSTCQESEAAHSTISESLRAVMLYLTRVSLSEIEAPEKLIRYQREIYYFLSRFYPFHLEEMLNLKSIAVLTKMKKMHDDWLQSDSIK